MTLGDPETVTLADGEKALLRPIGPGDATALQELVRRMTPEDLRLRFFAPLRELSPAMLRRLANPHPQREMALVVERPGTGELLAVGRFSAAPRAVAAEFAIAVRSDMKGQGLGYMLMGRIIAIARERGYKEVFGLVLRENHRMLQICEEYGFSLADLPDDPGVVRATRPL